MSLSTQFITMISMIGMGALFGAMLDTYQRFLKRPKRKVWIVFLNDLLFWAVQALIVFYVLFLSNKGELRFYIFVALLCGFAAYQSLLGSFYRKLLEIVISTAMAIYRFFKNAIRLLVYKPIVGLIQLLIAAILLAARGLFALVKILFKAILVIIKVILKPFGIILLFFWKLLPKYIKKPVEKLYNGVAGIILKIKNYVNRWLNRWKSKK
jgi:spore cortex biosynthesis protein YabQ